jgi:uncharacterized protein
MHGPILALALAAALAAPGSPSDQQKALAVELVHIIQTKEAYRDSMAMMSQQVSAALAAQARAQGSQLPPDFADRVLRATMEVAPYDEMVAWSADVYAQRFTVSELKDLVAFYRTPTGRKVARLLPEIMGEVGKKVGQLLPERMPEALRRQGLDTQGGRGRQSTGADAGP